MFFPKYNQEPNTHTCVSFCCVNVKPPWSDQILRFTLHLSLHTAISLHCLTFPEKVQLWNLSHMQVVYSLLSWQLLYLLPSYVRATFSEADSSLGWCELEQNINSTTTRQVLQAYYRKLIWELAVSYSCYTACIYRLDTLKVYHWFAPGAFSNSDFLPYFGHTGETEGLNKADAGKCFALTSSRLAINSKHKSSRVSWTQRESVRFADLRIKLGESSLDWWSACFVVNWDKHVV